MNPEALKIMLEAVESGELTLQPNGTFKALDVYNWLVKKWPENTEVRERFFMVINNLDR